MEELMEQSIMFMMIAFNVGFGVLMLAAVTAAIVVGANLIRKSIK